VEVVMKINLEGDIQKTIVTQLRAAGITGIVFVELDQKTPGAENLLSPTELPTPYPVIPSQPSQAKQMLSSVDRIMDKISQVDLPGISEQLIDTSHAIETFFTGREMKGILRSLDATAASLERGVGRIDRILAEGKVEGILKNANEGLGELRAGFAEARQFIADLRREVERIHAAETAGRARGLIDTLEGRTRRIASDLESTTDEIRRTTEDLRDFIEKVQENPSDLLFSKPARDERP